MKKISMALVLAGILFFNNVAGVTLLAATDKGAEKNGQATTASAAETKEETVRVIIQAASSDTKEALKREIALLPAAKLRNDFDMSFTGFSADIKESDYWKLQFDSRIAKITKAKLFYPVMASAKAIGQIDAAVSKFHNKGEGTVIAVIDSGLDVTHKDFQNLDDPSKAKVQTIMPFGGENKDTKFNLKVPYGFNFADNSYRIKGYASNHGMHVAGIAGANAPDSDLAKFAGIDGVASQAQIMPMVVFSNNKEAKGAQEDDIIAAIEKSIEKKVDVINMSLGSGSGFSDPEDPTAKAINKAREAGIMVVVAAGNDTAAFSNKMSKGVENIHGRKDIGIVGSPSTSPAALSVASMENTHTFIRKMTFMEKQQKVTFPYSLDNGKNDGSAHSVVDCGLGYENDFSGKSLQGKLALIKRGKITFTQKAKNAKAAGAAGAIIYNSDDIKTNYAIEGMGDFPVFNILNRVGVRLLQALQSDPNLQVTFNLQEEQDVNENSGNMSSFTSFGTTAELDFKPEITGIGGQVYSTDNDNKYVMMNGTSMASPYVAGASALVMSQVKKDLPGLPDYVGFTKKTLMNTAKIVMNKQAGNAIPFSVRRQGAGLIQVKNAMENRVLATYETADGEAAAALRSFSGSKSFKINLRNYSNRALTFTVDPGKVYTTETLNDNLLEREAAATISTDVKTLTLQPGAQSQVSVTLDAAAVKDNFVEGYVRFLSQTDGQPDIHFSYMGFAGDWNAENIFDNLDTLENKKEITYGDTRLMTMNKDPLNFFDRGEIVPLGVSPDDQKKGDVKPAEKYWSISPNKDGRADVVIPQIGILRSAKSVEFSILDQDKKELRKLGKMENVRRQSLRNFISRKESKQLFTTFPYIEGMWDGQLYNQQTGKMEAAADGQYYLAATAHLTANSEPQQLLFSLKVDTEAPTIELIKAADGKEYELTPQGRLFKFTVKDKVGVAEVKAEINKKTLQVTDKGDHYETLAPYSTEMGENVYLTVSDYAYNSKKVNVKNVKGNSLSFTNWKSVINKKINTIMGESYSGVTQNKYTAYISLKFVSAKDQTEITSKDCPVKNGKFAFASFVLTPQQQGKYKAFAIEKNADKKVIKETALGDFVYDYVKPSLTFNYVSELKGNDVKDPQKIKAKDPNYKEYVMRKNKDGSCTFTGKVQDNVYQPQELTLTIGTRENKVEIQKDGSFTYVLQTPSKHFDFINISQPAELSASNTSSLFEGLDLGGFLRPSAAKKKGLERTYVVTKYLEYDPNATPPTTGTTSEPEAVKPEFKLTVKPQKAIINIKETTRSYGQVEKRADGYYYKLYGYTNDSNCEVYVAGEKVTAKKTSSGLNFFKEVKLQEGMNNINVRATDATGNVLQELKVRILLDTKLPTLILDSPTIESEEAAPNATSQAQTPSGQQAPAANQGEKFELIKTWKDSVVFAGSIEDESQGYDLLLNGDKLLSYNSNGALGNNLRHFKRSVKVSDGSILILELADASGNGKVTKYKVKKVSGPKLVEVLDLTEEKTTGYVRVSLMSKDGKAKVYDVLAGAVDVAELPQLPADSDYRFDGWYLDEGCSKEFTGKITADMTLYPKFEPLDVARPIIDNGDEDEQPEQDSEQEQIDVRDAVQRLLPDRNENPTLPEPVLVPMQAPQAGRGSGNKQVVAAKSENKVRATTSKSSKVTETTLTSTSETKRETQPTSTLKPLTTTAAEVNETNAAAPFKRVIIGLIIVGSLSVLAVLLYILLKERRVER